MAIQFFGQYLLSRGVINEKQLQSAVNYQVEHNLKLGDYAVKKGYLTRSAARWINTTQRTRDLRFGEAAIELNLLTSEQVMEILEQQRADHVPIGQAVVRLGYAPEEVIDQCLVEYKQHSGRDRRAHVELEEGVPEAPVVEVFVEFTCKLLMRMAKVHNKVGVVRVAADPLLLPGLRVAIPLSGYITGQYLVAMPGPLAAVLGRNMLQEDVDSHEDLQDMVREFANIVTGNALARLAAEGRPVDMGPPDEVQESISLEGRKAAVAEIATPDHRLLAAILI